MKLLLLSGCLLISVSVSYAQGIGINTTTPQNMLDVEGNVAIGINYSGSTVAPVNGAIIEGKVGIGTSTAQNSLDIRGDGPPNFYSDWSTEGNAERSVLRLYRMYDGGAGADGIGARIGFLVETETEGTAENTGWISTVTTDATAGTVDADMTFTVFDNSTANEAIRIQSNGNVGIGTTVPASKLHLHMNTNTVYDPSTTPDVTDLPLFLRNTADHVAGGVQTGIDLSLSGDGRNRLAYIGAVTESAADNGLSLVFMTNETGTLNRPERMRITSVGYVGIGTTDPGTLLELAGDLGATGGFHINSSTGAAALIDRGAPTNNGNVQFLTAGTAEWLIGYRAGEGGNTDLSFYDLSTSTTTLHLEDNSGNVGIGTTAPSERLEIGNGNLRVNGLILYQNQADWIANSDQSAIYMTGGSGATFPFNTHGNLVLQPRTSNPRDIIFANGATTPSARMTITSTGNVGVGTTSPQRTFHISDVMRLEPRATAPSSPGKGDMYFDSTTNKLRVYDGASWQDCW